MIYYKMSVTKLNLACLDILLSQLSVDDLNIFEDRTERRVLSKLWVYQPHNKHCILFRAEDEDEAIYLMSKIRRFREYHTCISSSGERVINTMIKVVKPLEKLPPIINKFTQIYEYHCIICDVYQDDDVHYHNINKLTNEHWHQIAKEVIIKDGNMLRNFTIPTKDEFLDIYCD